MAMVIKTLWNHYVDGYLRGLWLRGAHSYVLVCYVSSRYRHTQQLTYLKSRARVKNKDVRKSNSWGQEALEGKRQGTAKVGTTGEVKRGGTRKKIKGTRKGGWKSVGKVV